MEFWRKLNPAYELMYIPDSIRPTFVFETNVLIEIYYIFLQKNPLIFINQ